MSDHRDAAPGTVVVTGCSSGIGLATAVALAGRGHHVVATVRDLGRAADLAAALRSCGPDAELRQLDVTDDASVQDCIGAITGSGRRIDTLVNNAGLGVSGTLEELSIDELARSLEVNLLGVARVTRAVLPGMRAQGRGHILAVSSIAGVFGQPFNDAYCAAKSGLEGLFESLSPVAGSFGIALSLVEAGPVTGGFVQRSEGRRDRGPDDPFAGLWDRFSRLVDGAYERAQTPEEVAEVIADVIADPAPRLRYQTSRSVTRTVAVKLADLTGERVGELTRSWLA